MAAHSNPAIQVFAETCRDVDPWLKGQTGVAEKRYRELGGQITVIVQEGAGHYPLAPADTKPVVDFITQNVK